MNTKLLVEEREHIHKLVDAFLDGQLEFMHAGVGPWRKVERCHVRQLIDNPNIYRIAPETVAIDLYKTESGRTEVARDGSPVPGVWEDLGATTISLEDWE